MTFDWNRSLGIVRFGTLALNLSSGDFHLVTSVQNPSFDICYFGYFAWELSLRNFRLITFTLALSLGNFDLESLGLGSLAWDP